MMTTRKRRLVSLLAMLLMLVPALTSCNDSDGPGEQESQSGVQENTPSEETVAEGAIYKADYLPEVTYDGYKYRIVDYEEYPMHIGEPAEDIINQAIYERNLKIAEKYDIEFEATTYPYSQYGNVATLIQTTAMAQSHDFDLATVVFKAAFNSVMSGYVPAASTLPVVDFTQPWYLKKINDSLYLDGMYLLGYTAFDLNAGGRGVIFNKEIVTELNLDNPYTLVNDGTWTYDAMYQMAEAAIKDLDGNGIIEKTDRFGIIGTPDNLTDFAYTGSGKLLVNVVDGIPEMSQDELLFDIFMKATDMIKIPGAYMNAFNFFTPITAGVEGLDWFKQGHALFSLMGSSYITTMGDMEDDYGLLPIPKWTVDQAEYYACQDGSRIALPLSCDPNLERTMTIKEALAVESLNITYPAYYENALKNRYVRDEESIQMLEIITAGVTLDLGQNPWWDLVRTPWYDTLTQGKDSYASAVASRIKQFDSTVKETIEQIEVLKTLAPGEIILKAPETTPAPAEEPVDLGAGKGGYLLGTISSTTGLNKENNTRFLYNPYITVEALEKVTINEGYEMIWLAYDANKAYIGNGTGNWIGAGVPFTKEDILGFYENAVFVRFAAKRMDEAEVKLDADIADSEVTITYVNDGWRVGTIASANGEHRGDTNRFMYDPYLPMDQFDKVNVNAGYHLIWLAYDANMKYIGNGTGNWLETGAPITRDMILATYANAAYARFAVKRADEADVNMDTDVAESGVAIVLGEFEAAAPAEPETPAAASKDGYMIGTIGSANGLSKENPTRFYFDPYLAIEQIDSVTINDGYEMIWFAYNANKTYLGNGGGNWLGAGVDFTTADITALYPDTAYIRFAAKRMDDGAMNLDTDVADSEITIVPTKVGYQVGTIGSANGESKKNLSRFFYEPYIAAEQLNGVIINDGYELIWFAYDTAKAYLGNGGGNWLGDGVDFTTKEILAFYPNTAYVRFAAKRMDGAEINLDTDIALSEVTIALTNVGYKVGTIGSANGEAKDNPTRFYYEPYIAIEQLETVTINDSYELIWFAYDVNRAYLGNGGGNWLGAGVDFTSAEIAAAYPDTAYIRFAAKRMDDGEMNLETDIAASEVTMVASGSNFARQ